MAAAVVILLFAGSLLAIGSIGWTLILLAAACYLLGLTLFESHKQLHEKLRKFVKIDHLFTTHRQKKRVEPVVATPRKRTTAPAGTADRQRENGRSSQAITQPAPERPVRGTKRRVSSTARRTTSKAPVPESAGTGGLSDLVEQFREEASSTDAPIDRRPIRSRLKNP
jgi:hypothetical protein